MRTLATLILIVLAAMLTMSMVFVVCGLAGIFVYVFTDRPEVGLVVGVVSWLGVHFVADFLKQNSYELRSLQTLHTSGNETAPYLPARQPGQGWGANSEHCLLRVSFVPGICLFL